MLTSQTPIASMPHSCNQNSYTVGAALLFALLSLAACDQKPGQSTAKSPAQARKSNPAKQSPATRDIPLHKSKIKTITGVELDKMKGPVGDWARNELKTREKKRQSQGWLRPVDIDFGEQPVGKELVAKAKLRNPTDKPHEIKNITSSCGCQKVVVWIGDKSYPISKAGHDPIPVPAGATGRVEAHVTVPERTGTVFTEVGIEISDPEVQHVRLSVRHIPVREFTVMTQGRVGHTVDFGLMSHSSVRPFEFQVKSRDGKPFRIVEHSEPADGMKLSYRPESDGGAVWKVSGSLGPNLRQRGFNGLVKFKTDRKQGFEIQVYALVIPPIRITPGNNLMLGIVSTRKEHKKKFDLNVVEPSDTFKVARVEPFDVPEGLIPAGKELGIAVASGAEDKSATVTLTIPKGAKKGQFNFGLRIVFEGDKFDAREVRAIGYVR